jgi:23S rRNA (cytidine1920-2'-O)/16S rRNA (cytidine1409-2'-O)-methyltransferase
MKASPKARLDILMVKQGLAETRDWAQRLIRAGEVRVNGQVMDMPARLFTEDVTITVQNPPKYVSRGGFKLEAALDQFHLSPAGLVCADVGSSTGGFTDCMLQRGALRIYALDVGNNQLHWKLRNDPRVVVHEGVNARYLEPALIGEPCGLGVCDVSFISVTLILPALASLLAAPREFVVLVKPQFESAREDVGRGGIIREPRLHMAAVERARSAAGMLGFNTEFIESPVLGAEGNKEFLLHGTDQDGRHYFEA